MKLFFLIAVLFSHQAFARIQCQASNQTHETRRLEAEANGWQGLNWEGFNIAVLADNTINKVLVQLWDLEIGHRSSSGQMPIKGRAAVEVINTTRANGTRITISCWQDR